MNSKALPFLVVLFFVLRPACRAQDADDAGVVKVTITRYADKSYTAMRTDPDSHSAESSDYNSMGKLVKTTVFEFDDQGKAVGGTVYSPRGETAKGTLLYKMRYKYDTLNRVCEVDNYSPSDELLSRQVYHYDAAGKVSKLDTYDATGNLINPTSTSAAVPDKKRAPAYGQ